MDTQSHLILFFQTFSTPQSHPKSQPFLDHVFTFTIADNRIWFRNYQVSERNHFEFKCSSIFCLMSSEREMEHLRFCLKYVCLLQIIEEDAAMVEIGPRFVLNLIKIFQGSFGGPTLFENPHFQSPNTVIYSLRPHDFNQEHKLSGTGNPLSLLTSINISIKPF